jgi:hypothetical protein
MRSCLFFTSNETIVLHFSGATERGCTPLQLRNIESSL